ncbi:MarR family winged helix-turn-helix transcriptional regulator [Shimia haliotis]|uniref:DNA-binding transcriptional regulator, MarR family n=1 Tax=Shimia haliotis TaxID=1280847 RepID=A0A1I4H816_9RHOB|nr:MarR family transcriptional regulator [Shimia haliotis]SFL38384.1 DNA-binding transcriptional regulator, MarR family [Shimia haliotis]
MTRSPRIFLLMNRAYAALARAADRRTKAEGDVSLAQHGVLFALTREDGLTVSALARMLSMGKPSVSGMVDRLAVRGLVRRQRDDADGRVVRVLLQTEGAALVARTKPVVREMNAALLAPFDEPEQEVIGRFLKHVADNAEDVLALGASEEKT